MSSAPTSVVARALNRPGGRGLLLFERNVLSYKSMWPIIVSGFFEPLFFLLSLGYGLGSYVGDVSIDGVRVEYAVFVAPGLLAASAMNGAFYDATNIFWKMRYQKLYDSILSTPLGPKDVAAGETVWALFRGLIYAVGFFTVILALGLVESWWAVLALPATVFIGFAFAGAGIAAVTYMRSWQDFDILNLAILPMFLFSATFFPLSTYPDWLETVIQATPLYHGVELLRALTTGAVGSAQIGNVVYLAVLGVLGTWIASRRIAKLLLT
ncbi:MAG: ABC transporter permease [Gaiellaceae bacterium]